MRNTTAAALLTLALASCDDARVPSEPPTGPGPDVGTRVLVPHRSLGDVRGRRGPLSSTRPIEGCLEATVVSHRSDGVVVQPDLRLARERLVPRDEVLELPILAPPALEADDWVCARRGDPQILWVQAQVVRVTGGEVTLSDRSGFGASVYKLPRSAVVAVPEPWATALAADFQRRRPHRRK